MTTRKNPHIGGLFDGWPKTEGLHEDVTNKALNHRSLDGLRADLRKGIDSGPSKPWSSKKLKQVARIRRSRAAKAGA